MIRTIGGDTRFLDVGALLPAESYGTLIEAGQFFGSPVRMTSGATCRPDGSPRRGSEPVLVDLRRLEPHFPQTQVTNGALPGVRCGAACLPLLVAHQTRWASATAVLTVVAIGPAAVAFAALALVATIAARRRRPRPRSGPRQGRHPRPARPGGVPRGLRDRDPGPRLAILLSIVLIPAGSDRASIIAASAVAATAVGLLIVTAMPGTTAAARSPRDETRARAASRLGALILDLVGHPLAAGGAYLLRERGVRGASSTGALASADPLIAAVPALAGIAAGLTAIRLVALPLRLLGRIAARGRGLVPLLALRRAIHGGTTAAVLSSSSRRRRSGPFSSAALVHLDRASTAASWHDIGAPIRVTSQVGALPARFDPADPARRPPERVAVQDPVPVGRARPPDPVRRDRPRGLWPMIARNPGRSGLPRPRCSPRSRRTGSSRSSSRRRSPNDPDGVPSNKPFEIVIEGYRVSGPADRHPGDVPDARAGRRLRGGVASRSSWRSIQRPG